MRKLQCDLCGVPLTVQAGGQRAVCGNCGLEYPMERLRELRAEWPATVLLVTDHAEYLDALEADVVQLPQAEPVFDALWEPLPDTL